MSIWSEISYLVSRLSSGGRELMERLSEAIAAIQANRRSVAFTVAIIALSAKMAKADGVVTPDEVSAFRKLCDIPPGEEANVKRLFDLAKEDVAGFDAYAARLASLLDNDFAILEDVLDGLFSIAKADGILHENELNFLRVVGQVFGFAPERFEQVLYRHVELRNDPYKVLGLARGASLAEVQARRKQLMREHHPDRLMARGVPQEFVRLANDRVAAINAAYDEINRERKAS